MQNNGIPSILFFTVINLQILIDKEQTILRKNTLLVLEGGSDIGGKISNDANGRVDFLLCPSCFWCASCLSSQMSSAMAAAKANCPSRVGGKIESIPIAENEEYEFDYDTERGVTMEFFR